VRHRGLIQYATDLELGEVPHIRTPIRIGEGIWVYSFSSPGKEITRRAWGESLMGNQEVKTGERTPGLLHSPAND
jgi:hypothetical protein